MASLPSGWEWDYDGSRWLYRYKSTGYVQYHFPKAGDEFPDYVDFFAPVPELAPEERLESQQQVRRHASKSGGGDEGAERRDREKREQQQQKNGMSAVAQPVSSVWEAKADEEEGEGDVNDSDEDAGGADGVFQPESFMFLGPGTYADVSPLVEEEEEAAKRTVVGIDEEITVASDQGGAAVSPVMSANTTPVVKNSQPAAAEDGGRETCQAQQTSSQDISPTMKIGRNSVAAAPAIDGEQDMEMFELPAETAASMDQQQPFDPVGVLAEMPTEETAPARIETCPSPIEMADTSVLVPVKAKLPYGVPEKTTSRPVERRASGDEAPREQHQREPHIQKECVEQEQQRRMHERQSREQQIQEQRLVAERLHHEEVKQAHQGFLKPRSYSEAGTSSGGSFTSSSASFSGHLSSRNSHSLDYSMASRRSLDQTGIPAALAGALQTPPPRPPKIKEEDWQAMRHVHIVEVVEQTRDEFRNHEQNMNLSHVPSLLKPGRRMPDSSGRQPLGHPSIRAAAQAVRYPSILRPGPRSTARSYQQDSSNSGEEPSPPSSLELGRLELGREAQRPVYEPPRQEQHSVKHVTMLPYPEVFPGEIVPPCRRQSAIQNHTGLFQSIKQPARPASAMPVLEYGRQQLAELLNPQPVNQKDHSSQKLQRRQSQGHSPSQSFQSPYPQGLVMNEPDSRGMRYANFASRPAQPPQVISIQRRPSQKQVSPSRSRAESDTSILPAAPHPPAESRRRSAGPLATAPNLRAPNLNGHDPDPSPEDSRTSPTEPHTMRNANHGPKFHPNDPSFVQKPAALVDHGEDSRRHSMPTHQHINATQPVSRGQEWRAPSPYPEDFGPPEHSQGGLQRSQSLNSSGRAPGQPRNWQGCQQQGPQSPTRPAPMHAPAQSLTRIDEHLVECGELSRYPSMQPQKRHSLPGGPLRHSQYSADQHQQRVQHFPNPLPASGPAPNRERMPQQTSNEYHPQPPMQQAQGPVSQPQQYPRPPMRPGGEQMMPDQRYPSQSQINLHQPIAPHQQRLSPPNHQVARANPVPTQGSQAPPIGQPTQMRPKSSIPPWSPKLLQSANQRQPPWKLQTSSDSPRPLRPVSGPPLPTPLFQTPLSPTTKEKGQGWTKWFRSSKSNVQSSTAPSQPTYPPVDIPPPLLGPTRSMTYSAGDTQHLGGWQPGRPTAHPAHHENGQQPVMASPIHGRPIRDTDSPCSVSPISGRSSIRPSFDSQFSGHQRQDVGYFPGRQQGPSNVRPPRAAGSDSSSVHSFPARPSQHSSPVLAPHNNGGMMNGEDARRFSSSEPLTPENKFKVVSKMVGLPLRPHQHQHQHQPPQHQHQPRRFPTPPGSNFTDTDDNAMPAPLFNKSTRPSRISAIAGETGSRKLTKQPQWAVRPVSDSSGDEWRGEI